MGTMRRLPDWTQTVGLCVSVLVLSSSCDMQPLRARLDPKGAFERGVAERDTHRWEWRATMLRNLGERGTSVARSALESEESERMRIRFALEVLGPLGDIGDRERILGVLDHRDRSARADAAVYLGQFYDCKDILSRLRNEVETQDDAETAEALLIAMSRTGQPIPEELLLHVHRWEGTADWTKQTAAGCLAATVARLEALQRDDRPDAMNPR